MDKKKLFVTSAIAAAFTVGAASTSTESLLPLRRKKQRESVLFRELEKVSAEPMDQAF